MKMSDSESESAILKLLHTVRVRVGHFWNFCTLSDLIFLSLSHVCSDVDTQANHENI